MKWHQAIADAFIRATLALLVGVYGVGVAVLLFGGSISFVSGMAGIVVGLSMAAAIIPKNTRRLALSSVSLVLLVCSFPAAWFFDYSWDGWGYHKLAVIQLMDGWNPYRSAPPSEDLLAGWMTGKVGGGGLAFWTVVYPKASWVISAQLTAISGSLEQAKVINILALLPAFFSAWRFLAPRMTGQPLTALVAAGLIGLNPVAVYQSPTFYVDGLVASFFTVLLFALAELFKQPASKAVWFEVFSSSVLLANVKFTGAVYVGCLLALFACFMGLRWGRSMFFRIGIVCAGILVIALLVFGKSPYFDNIAAGRSPLFPVLNEGFKADQTGWSMPVDFKNKDRASRWLISNFSHSNNCHAPQSSELRWPFDLSKTSRHWVDLNQGGFGPLFGECLLLSLAACLAGWRFLKRPGMSALFLFAGIVVSSFVHDQAWWARYAPQMFLLPVLACCWAVTAQRVWPTRWVNLCLALLFLNLVIVGTLSTGSKALASYRWHKGLEEMRQASLEGPIGVDLQEYIALKRNLVEKGVDFRPAVSDGSERWRPMPIFKTCAWRVRCE